MHPRTRSVIVAAWLVLPIIGASGIVSVVEAALATRCCAATDYTCAGLRAPDDCCKHMRHIVGAATSATIERIAHMSQPFVTVAIAPPARALATVSSQPIPSPTAKRLHDPPHLHAFALLI